MSELRKFHNTTAIFHPFERKVWSPSYKSDIM